MLRACHPARVSPVHLCMARLTTQHRASICQYAAHYRVPPELIAAFIDVESRWNPERVSNKGAMGLMQLMPATARRYGAFAPFDVEQNIAAGTRYVAAAR